MFRVSNMDAYIKGTIVVHMKWLDIQQFNKTTYSYMLFHKYKIHTRLECLLHSYNSQMVFIQFPDKT